MITRKPKASSGKEKRFIQRAGKNGAAKANGRQLTLKPVLCNFDQALLDRATAEAQNMGLNRNAFISMCVAVYLNKRDQQG